MKPNMKVRRMDCSIRAHSRISPHSMKISGSQSKLLYAVAYVPPLAHTRVRGGSLPRSRGCPRWLRSHVLGGDRPSGSQPDGMSKSICPRSAAACADTSRRHGYCSTSPLRRARGERPARLSFRPRTPGKRPCIPPPSPRQGADVSAARQTVRDAPVHGQAPTYARTRCAWRRPS